MNNALYNQIRIFQSIAREGNISAAARKLEITPPVGQQCAQAAGGAYWPPPFCAHYPAYQLTETGQQLLEQTAAAGGGDTGRFAGNHPRPESGALRGSA